MGTQHGYKTVRCQRPDENALMALPVIDELATHTPMRLILRVGKFADRDIGPIFAETIRKHAVFSRRSPQIKNKIAERLNGPNRFDVNKLGRRIPDRYLNISEGPV